MFSAGAVVTRYQPPPLDYARRPPRAKRIALLVLLLAVATALVPLTLKYARSAAERIELRRLYSRGAQHVAAADAVVYDEDPVSQKALLGGAKYQQVGGHHGPIAFRTVPQWEQFVAANRGRISSHGTLFLGELATPSGRKRLVGVDITGWSRGGPVILFTYARTFTPVTLAKLPAMTASSPSLNLARGEGILRLFAGQADPSDPAHFTIRYTFDDQPGVIDGWLKDDGTVLLEPRSAPPGSFPSTGGVK